MAVDAAASRARKELGSRAAAEDHVRSRAFRLGIPRLIGVELEWLTARADGTESRPELTRLVEALGPHAPRTVAPSSSARPRRRAARSAWSRVADRAASVPCTSRRQV
ncbi:glutamate--cysteine ligase, partial [Rhodococcus sp. IITR03]